jgi:nicotinamidase-related amidase
MVQKTEDNKTALIIIDIQNDYPGGTMELASADDTKKERTYCLI